MNIMRPSVAELSGYLASGLSEREIGDICGVSRNVVHTWLYYKRKPQRGLPTIGHIAVGLTLGLKEWQIAVALNVPRSTVNRMRSKAGLPGGTPGRNFVKRSEDGTAEQPYRVRLLEDETVWFGVLAGARYQDAATNDGGIFRRSRPSLATGNSSMAWAG